MSEEYTGIKVIMKLKGENQGEYEKGTRRVSFKIESFEIQSGMISP
jgi:hypothetical protein